MSLLKNFIEDEWIISAKQQIYEDVQFPIGFAKFIEALEVENIIKGSATRTKTDNGYIWLDEVRQGGIQLETTEYPFSVSKFAGTISITGSKDNIEIVHSILERHGVMFKGKTTANDIELHIQYHKELNPKLWNTIDNELILQDDIDTALEELSQSFYEFLDMDNLDIEDITITGSSANYNWTDNSDLDIHLVVDMKLAEKKYGKLCVQYFDAQRKIWNDLHNVEIKGIPVEFYIQDKKEIHNSTGIYSLSDKKWIVKPKYEAPSIDNTAVKQKAASWMTTIDQVVSTCNKATTIEKVMDKLSKLRQAGLDKGGEFSIENLCFKTLRNCGYLELLANCKTRALDRELSIQEEEWSQLQY